MHIRYRWYWSHILTLTTLSLFGWLTFALAAEPPQFGYVFLHDGTALHGKIIREGKDIEDNGHEIWIPKVGGFYLVDDGVRHIVFSHHNVSEARPEPTDRPQYSEEVRIFRVLNAFPMNPTFPTAFIEEASQWDREGKRIVTISQAGPGTPTKQLEQAITRITPHWAQAETKTYRFSYRMLTSELDPTTTLQMLRDEHEKRQKQKAAAAAAQQKRAAKEQEEAKAAESKDEGEKKPSAQPAAKPPQAPPAEPDDAFKLSMFLFRFCIHAGWLEQAEQERGRLIRDFPDRKKLIDDAAKELRQVQEKLLQEDIELAFRTGQHALAQRLIADFKEEGADPAIIIKVNARKTQYQELGTQLADVRRLLASVQSAAKTQIVASFKDVLAEINRDLNLDTCGRLEPFRALALQEERLQGQGPKNPGAAAAQGQPAQTVTTTPDQLLALAVSGWILGKDGADTNTAATLQLWKGRQAVLHYLREPEAHQREQVLSQYLQEDPLRVDMIKQVIELLPPPMPQPITKDTAFHLEAGGSKQTDKVKYRVQLPPEYHPQRPYPVMLVLPNIHEDLMALVNRWGPLAAKHGYLLVVPQWTELGQSEYRYSDRERESVLSVLQDLRRRFNVDGDRVVMFGYDQAGTMAYDVGLSHPDVFAGVATMSAGIGEVADRHYRTHGQYLPFYVVEGDRRPKYHRDRLRGLFTYWVQRGFPSLYVEYIGRGVEFYAGELPYIVDWMDRKKRPQKLPKLGDSDGKELKSVRESDNRYYWLSSDDIVTGPNVAPAKFTARIAEGNSIVGQVSGVKQLTVWLNSSMVDFAQPVDIRISQSNAARGGKKMLEPSAKVLLEDFYNRGDKKNLYVAKVELSWR